VNAKPERGTLREVLRSGAQLDPIKMVRKHWLVGRSSVDGIYRSRGSHRSFF
jgi:hypothetical protein